MESDDSKKNGRVQTSENLFLHKNNEKVDENVRIRILGINKMNGATQDAFVLND